MARAIALIYGVACYAVFVVTFLYTIAFVGNIQSIAGETIRLGGLILVPKTIDFPIVSGSSTGISLLINVLLMSVFALQHSVMARPAFKKVWTKIVPKPVERSTYVLLASGTLILLFSFWIPIPAHVWTISGSLQGVVTLMYFLAFAFVVGSIVMIDHLDLLGLRQVIDNLSEKPRKVVQFVVRGPFILCRHPIMLGLLIAVWAVTSMTVGHLLFSVMTTVYILVALIFEEKDLVAEFGESYRQYQRTTPKLMPTGRLGRKPARCVSNSDTVDGAQEVERKPNTSE